MIFDREIALKQATRFSPQHPMFQELFEQIHERLGFFKNKPSNPLWLYPNTNSMSEIKHDCLIDFWRFQYTNNPEIELQNLLNCLMPGGVLLVVFPGGNSLMEWRHALYDAEMTLNSSIHPRVAPWIKIEDMARFMQKTKDPVIDSINITLQYKELSQFLSDIPKLALSNCLDKRSRKPLSKKFLNCIKMPFITFEVIFAMGAN